MNRIIVVCIPAEIIAVAGIASMAARGGGVIPPQKGTKPEPSSFRGILASSRRRATRKQSVAAAESYNGSPLSTRAPVEPRAGQSPRQRVLPPDVDCGLAKAGARHAALVQTSSRTRDADHHTASFWAMKTRRARVLTSSVPLFGRDLP